MRNSSIGVRASHYYPDQNQTPFGDGVAYHQTQKKFSPPSSSSPSTSSSWRSRVSSNEERRLSFNDNSPEGNQDIAHKSGFFGSIKNWLTEPKMEKFPSRAGSGVAQHLTLPQVRSRLSSTDSQLTSYLQNRFSFNDNYPERNQDIAHKSGFFGSMKNSRLIPRWLILNNDAKVLFQQLNGPGILTGMFIVRPSLNDSTTNFTLLVRLEKLKNNSLVHQFEIVDKLDAKDNHKFYKMCGLNFETLDDLVEHFRINPLPGIDLTLQLI